MSRGKAAKKAKKRSGHSVAHAKILREQQRPRLIFPEELPVSAMLGEIQAAIKDRQVVIVAGATG